MQSQLEEAGESDREVETGEAVADREDHHYDTMLDMMQNVMTAQFRDFQTTIIT